MCWIDAIKKTGRPCCTYHDALVHLGKTEEDYQKLIRKIREPNWKEFKRNCKHKKRVRGCRNCDGGSCLHHEEYYWVCDSNSKYCVKSNCSPYQELIPRFVGFVEIRGLEVRAENEKVAKAKMIAEAKKQLSQNIILWEEK